MKVTLEKYGGLAAGIARKPATVDAAVLPSAAAAELNRLVEAAKSTQPTEIGGPGKARDAMSYDITVEDADGSIVLTQSDAGMSPAFAALMKWIRLQEKP